MALTESHAVGPTTPPIREITLGELLREAAATVPARVALVKGVSDPAARRQWTYAELYAEAERAACALSRRFAPGERIAVWAANVPEWVITEFACAMAGVVLVTVNPAFRAAELTYVLKQSRSAGILTMREYRGTQMLAMVREVAPQCPDLREIIELEHWDAFVASAGDTAVTLPAVKPGDTMMIQYTSGTTGFPKGALLHHRGLLNNAAHVADGMGIEDGYVWVTAMPMFHTSGSALSTLGAVSKHATIVLVEAFEPGLVLELFETYRGNVMGGVPTMLIALLEHPTFATRDLSSVRVMNSGGSTVPAPLVQRLEKELRAPFTIVFGQTECSPVASMTRPTDSVEDKARTIGGPMPHVEVKIVDPATGKTVAPGVVGEYCTRGYHVMHEYFDMPKATAETIDEDGWLHTGDLCAMDARGYCTVEGRLKDMIIRGGENIYPRELEELLHRHPAVGDVAVVGLPDDKWGEVVGAFVRPAPNATIDPAELTAYVREHLAPHKTPRHWFVVTEFPLTASGKIQKYRLREQWKAGAFAQQ
jgi:fatty-acyl-CoA synthase